MSNWFKNLSDKITNEFTNPDSDLLSGRFVAKLTKPLIETKVPVSEKKIQTDEQEKKEVPVGFKPIVCYRCGRGGHKSPYCHERTHIDGHDI
jgi:CDGSH-type Zn-finger protein